MQKSENSAREAAERLLRENPRFKISPKSGQGFVVGGPEGKKKKPVRLDPEGFVGFAYLDVYPVRFNPSSGVAFICYDNKTWNDLHIADAMAKAKLLRKDEYLRAFPNLPLLPERTL